MPRELAIKFDRHGLGDCVHFAHALQLYKRRGYDITVQVEENKLFIWKVAGVNIVQGGGLPDHPYGYPSGFDDLNAPDHEKNKVSFGLKHDVMPSLSDLDLTSEQAWEELCGIRLSAHDHIPPGAHSEAEQFLEGLPRPIICLHSRGTNWHERKSLPTDVAFDVILKLLDQTAGSVIVLDFDRRAPMVGDARCKGIKPGWGHIGIDRLCALFERSDLVIGVDSGPFHVAALTNVKALGVFRSLHPNRVCLPNPNAVYLVSGQFEEQWCRRQETWELTMYTGPEPTADDIADAAVSILSGATTLTSTEQSEAIQRCVGRYTYDRVGHDNRAMELLLDGTIGEGRDGCEQRWKVRIADGVDVIEIHGKHGMICSCKRTGDKFVGTWTQFEKMPIELRPLSNDSPRSVDFSDGQLRLWSNEEASRVFPTYHRTWQHSVGSRGNGMIWLLDPAVERSDLDACGVDHEDWIFKYLQVERGATVVDLASFIGTNAVRWAKDDVNVIAIEPIPQNRDLLYRNLILNGVLNRVTVIPKAFGNRRGMAQMVKSHYTSHLSDTGDCTVEVTTIDDELLPWLSRLDLLKLDVEGAECEVIEGAQSTLERFRPRLVIEVHSHMEGREANGTILSDQLKRLGYSHRQIWKNTPAYYYIEALPN